MCSTCVSICQVCIDVLGGQKRVWGALKLRTGLNPLPQGQALLYAEPQYAGVFHPGQSDLILTGHAFQGSRRTGIKLGLYDIINCTCSTSFSHKRLLVGLHKLYRAL